MLVFNTELLYDCLIFTVEWMFDRISMALRATDKAHLRGNTVVQCARKMNHTINKIQF